MLANPQNQAPPATLYVYMHMPHVCTYVLPDRTTSESNYVKWHVILTSTRITINIVGFAWYLGTCDLNFFKNDFKKTSTMVKLRHCSMFKKKKKENEKIGKGKK